MPLEDRRQSLKVAQILKASTDIRAHGRVQKVSWPPLTDQHRAMDQILTCLQRRPF